MTRTTTLLAAAALALGPGLASADSHTGQGGHEGHMDMGQMNTATPEPMQGYMGAMQAMMDAMPMGSAGDPDADFLLMMIPHHQSAIDMARVELEHGDDAETRAMAQAIIDAQEAEIAQMRDMLRRMGVDTPAP